MTLVVGAFCGLGLFALVLGLLPRRTGAAATVVRIDRLRGSTRQEVPAAGSDIRLSDARSRIGTSMAQYVEKQGWKLTSLRADLAIMERSLESHLAAKALLTFAGFILGPILSAALWITGVASGLMVPLWATLLACLLCFFLPDLEVKRDGKEKRAAFRRVLSNYLDLVAMGLRGGRGLPESLKEACEISDSWAMLRIRRCLGDARLTGTSHWVALRVMGEQIDVLELQDLGAALALVSEDGARVSASLAARAKTMRQNERAAQEAAANAQSQSMLVAQLLLGAGFLIFLAYPALLKVMQL